jgi:hypothetical protein
MLLMVVPVDGVLGAEFEPDPDELDGDADGAVLVPEGAGTVGEVVEPPGSAFEALTGAGAPAVLAGSEPVPPHPATAMTTMLITTKVKTKKGKERTF